MLAATFLAAAAFTGGYTVQPIGFTDGQIVSGTVHIVAQPSGDTQRVEISLDGRLRTIATTAPYAFDWDTTVETNGPHLLQLWAVGKDGSVATSQITLNVQNTFQVALGGLAAGQTVTGTIHLSPALSGLPAQWVDILVDGELRWSLAKSPYAVDWDTALETAGAHTVTVRAVAVGGFVATVQAQVTVAGGQTADETTVLAQSTRFRAQTWAYQTLMRVPRTSSNALQGTLAELVLWRSRAAAARLKVSHPQHYDQWMCIHSHEAAWTSHDSGHNGHYGGLQMSFDFMRGYGPEIYAVKGTADHWTPLEQMWVAERAWKVRGYNPWPETARMCGLLR
jgi:hypothetical protein